MLNLKRIILLSTFLLLYTGSLHAQWIKSRIPKAGNIRCLVALGADVFAGTGDGEVFRFSNNGKNWAAVSTGLPSNNSYVQALAVSGTNLFAGTIFVEGDDGKDGDGGVFLSTNNGKSWTAVNNGLTNNNVFSLAASGTNLFAGTWGGGVFRSADNGTSWTAANNGLTHTNVFALAVSGTNLFAGTPIGVFRSTNNGRSWTQINSGLTKTFVWSLAVSGTNVIAGTDGGAFLSTNNGTSWTAISNGLTKSSVIRLAVSDTNLFATTDSGVFLSTNNGASWLAVNTGLLNRRTTALAASDVTLFAATEGAIWTRPLSQMIKPDHPTITSENSTRSTINGVPKMTLNSTVNFQNKYQAVHRWRNPNNTYTYFMEEQLTIKKATNDTYDWTLEVFGYQTFYIIYGTCKAQNNIAECNLSGLKDGYLSGDDDIERIKNSGPYFTLKMDGKSLLTKSAEVWGARDDPQHKGFIRYFKKVSSFKDRQ